VGVSYSIAAGIVVALLLGGATYPLARHAAVKDGDPGLVRIIMAALVLKLVGSLIRYWVAFVLYDGSADAAGYLGAGNRLAAAMRLGDFSFSQTGGGGSSGTLFIRQVTGWVLFVTGPSPWAAFLVFAWFSFLGLYLFHRAFKLAVPGGDGRRYAYLVFFLPTLLYWPSSVGKEAWMLMMLGLGALGVARIFTHRSSGYVITAASLAGCAAVRPHMAVLLGAGLAAGFMLRRSKANSKFGVITRVVGAAAIVVGMSFAVQATEERFDVEGEGVAGAEAVIERTSEQTSQGGSEFEATSPGSLRDLPYAAFTVMFRPLPFEAHNAQALVTSFEGVFLLGFVALAIPRLRRLPREMFRTPYLTFAAVYSLAFITAFASFGNFGILARQRSQLFPLVMVLLAFQLRKDDTDEAVGISTSETGPQPRGQRAPVLTFVASPETTDGGGPGDRSRAPQRPGSQNDT
jgi:hypothetical protein